jgi:hypothetical protein
MSDFHPVPTVQRAGNPLEREGCEPNLYVDGHIQRTSTSPMVSDGQYLRFAPKLNKVDDFDVVPITVVEAIEVYVGAITPMQYRSSCGVILVWTRRGG